MTFDFSKLKKERIDVPILYSSTHWSIRKRVREQYVKDQKGKCCHCERMLNASPPAKIIKARITRDLFPPNFFESPVHLHHCHKTDLTIGAVHARCNAYLWEHLGE